MEKYRDLGIKLTPQRIEILKFLDGNKNHPSAEDIFKFVSERFPTMSFATVYNTLEALKIKGEVSELIVDSCRKRYDPDTEHHNHLICTKCKKIIDIHKEYDLVIANGQRKGFKITGNNVEFYGICPECQKNIND